MELKTVLTYALAIVETLALLAALVYITQALHDKKLQRNAESKSRNTAKKTSGKNSALAQKETSASYRKAVLFFAVYLALNIVRRLGLLG